MRFFVLTLMVLCCANTLEALTPGGPGVCVAKRSVRKTRQKYYNVKSWCKGRRCVLRKSKAESYKAIQNETICCTGWSYSSDYDICAPRCSMGCVGGRCIAPEVCHCDPPATLHPLHNNTCLTCNPPCENAKCVNNTCICLEGYVQINNTCRPVCDSCVNGQCVGPNSCKCLPGYINNGGCKPLCDNCVNGVCSEPNVCSCEEGYLRNGSGCYKPCPEKCTSCGADGVCQDEGCDWSRWGKLVCCNNWIYDKKIKRCLPHCQNGCGEGECIAPDVCKCKPPYLLDSSNRCVLPPPVCDSPCTSGTCTANNTCTCHDGYIHKDTYNCVPECKQSCKNGDCVAPNTCKCLVGYKSKDQWTCEPVCDECDNGECIGPNICKCNKGYTKVSGKCLPVCDRECQNGYCGEPNQCKCNLGYEIDPLDRFNCRPVCNPPCINASCVTPNICSCFPGYESLNTSICKPKCDYCSNGDCVAPNKCRCHKGYEMIGIKCKPICSRTCVNSFCSEPNTCQCNVGYEHDSRDKFTCNAICNQKCVNATCILPNKCQCLEGYEKNANNFSCRPKCSSCEHGQCVFPEICSCNDGYFRENGTCVPICSELCVNGNCIAPNECDCRDGYTRNETKPSMCYKPCSRACTNGVCNINGECICNRGFELKNETCIVLETMNCENCDSNCGSDGECWCSNGHPCSNNTYRESAGIKSAQGLAGLQLTWLLGGCVGFLLLTLLIVIMGHMWRKRRDYSNKSVDGGNAYGSVIYTVPDTLMNRHITDNKIDNNLYNDIDEDDDEEGESNEQERLEAAERLLASQIVFESDKIINCENCDSNCGSDGECWCSNGHPCSNNTYRESAGIKSAQGLAGLQLTWLLGGCVGFLLLTLLIVIMGHMWRKRRDYSNKSVDGGNAYGSVIYTVPDTLMNRHITDNKIDNNFYNDIDEDDDEEGESNEQERLEAAERLLASQIVFESDKM